MTFDLLLDNRAANGARPPGGTSLSSFVGLDAAISFEQALWFLERKKAKKKTKRRKGC